MLTPIIAAFLLFASQAQPVPMDLDGGGRPTIEVMINGEGPFDFVVDTAAQVHVVMPRLVDRLALTANAGGAQVQGASGRSSAQSHTLDSISSGAFSQQAVRAVALPNATVTDAWGIVGMRGFADQKVLFDTVAKTFAVTPSGPPTDGMVAEPAKLFSTFAIVDILIDGKPVKAVIDSGARRTVANERVLAALGWTADDARLSVGEPIRGATNDTTAARDGQIGEMTLGEARFADVTVTFADLAVFAPLGLADQPAVILGFDILGRLPAFAVDYPRKEFQYRLPPPSN